MDPYLLKNKIAVADVKIASTLTNKGSFGEKIPGGLLKLSLLEGAYLMENGRITVRWDKGDKKMDHTEILEEGMRDDPHFMENYLVHRDLRNRGLIAKESGAGSFLIYPRGGRPGKSKPDGSVTVRRENDSQSVQDLYLEALKRENIFQAAVTAVVDGDWDITYYRVEVNPFDEGGENEVKGIEGSGRIPIPRGGAIIKGVDPERIRKDLFIGTALDSSMLLSEEEDRYLNDIDHDPEGIHRIKWDTYKDLRGRGWFVRTGFKYGTHFRVYTRHPDEDHSAMLVHCMPGDQEITWEEFSRGVRLCHSVNKRMIYAFDPVGLEDTDYRIGSPSYLHIGWIRP